MKKTYTAALHFVATTARLCEGTGAFTTETVCGAFPTVIDAELSLALNPGDTLQVNRVRDADGKLVCEWRTAAGAGVVLANQARATLVALVQQAGWRDAAHNA
jgi:hypothetical protein